MENKLLIFNMKTIMNIQNISTYLKEVPSLPSNAIVCPEMIYVPYFIGKYKVALQNVYFNGSYTGEVNVSHLKKMGIDYVVVGHSERRNVFNESNDLINQKVKACLDNNIKVILCIGETLEEREQGNTFGVLKEQIEECLKDIDSKDIIIAYEPVWAIGTGKTPSVDDIKNTIDYIKKICHNLIVVYGGSVNKNNISSLNNINGVDGFMIGKSSTIVDEVKKIIEVVNG